MIKKVKRKNINLEKYSTCLSQASNYRIYAEAWYLDALTNKQWDCLVYGDYEVIMPIPYQKKLGIKLVILPPLCQQLGVFYKQPIDNSLFKQFEKRLHQMLVRSYSFNEENTKHYQPKGELRVNHVLDLNKPYEEIYKNYRKNRKKDIRESKKLNYTVKKTHDITSFYNLLHENHKNIYGFLSKNIVKSFLNQLVIEGKILLLQVMDSSSAKVLLQRGFLLSNNRIYLLISARNKNEKANVADPFLIDFIIQESFTDGLFLDFEGSSVKGIASFNESFGANKHYYTTFKNIRLSI